MKFNITNKTVNEVETEYLPRQRGYSFSFNNGWKDENFLAVDGFATLKDEFISLFNRALKDLPDKKDYIIFIKLSDKLYCAVNKYVNKFDSSKNVEFLGEIIGLPAFQAPGTIRWGGTPSWAVDANNSKILDYRFKSKNLTDPTTLSLPVSSIISDDGVYKYGEITKLKYIALLPEYDLKEVKNEFSFMVYEIVKKEN